MLAQICYPRFQRVDSNCRNHFYVYFWLNSNWNCWNLFYTSATGTVENASMILTDTVENASMNLMKLLKTRLWFWLKLLKTLRWFWLKLFRRLLCDSSWSRTLRNTRGRRRPCRPRGSSRRSPLWLGSRQGWTWPKTKKFLWCSKFLPVFFYIFFLNLLKFVIKFFTSWNETVLLNVDQWINVLMSMP